MAEIRTHTQLPWRWRGALPSMLPGSGAEAQLHCTSYVGNYPTMIKAAADRGRIILVGATSGSVLIESNELFRREIMMTGSYQTGMSDTHPYWPWTRVRNQHVILRPDPAGRVEDRTAGQPRGAVHAGAPAL